MWSLNLATSGLYSVYLDYASTDTDGKIRFAMETIAHVARGRLGNHRQYQPVSSSAARTALPRTRQRIFYPSFYRRRGNTGHKRPQHQTRTHVGCRRESAPATSVGAAPCFITPETDGAFELPVNACEVYGKSLSFDPQQQSLAFSPNPEESAEWTLHAPDSGTYIAFAEYACGQSSAHSWLTISCRQLVPVA